MRPEIQDRAKTVDQIRKSQGRHSIHERMGSDTKICGDLVHRKYLGLVDKHHVETPRPLQPSIGGQRVLHDNLL